MARRQDSPDKPQHSPWFPIVLLLIGLLVPAGGLWFLSATNRPPAVAGVTRTPVSQPSATATTAPPTATPNAMPTTNVEPTRVAPAATPTVAPAAAPLGEAIDIAIVHSNDTWGYILPCG
jgi:hypothetical protein